MAMRVVWVVHSLDRNTGTILMEWVVPLLIEAGVAVDVLPLYPPSQPGHLSTVEGAAVLDPPIQGRFTAKLQISGVLRRAYHRYHRVIVDQNLDLELKAVTAMGGVMGRAPLIMVAHVPLTEYLAARGEHNVGGQRRMIDALYPKIDRIITLSDAATTDLMEYHGVAKNRVVKVSVPLPIQKWQSEAQHPVPHPFLETDVPIISSLGYLETLKGIEVLINAVRLVQDQSIPIKLLVMGDGPLRAQQEKLAASLGVEALFPGWVPEWGAWLSRSKIFVAPQYFDGAGWDLYAAMSVGIPVIATNAPHVSREVLSNGTLGKIASIGEPVALAEGIQKWLGNDRIRSAFALGGKQRARALDRDRVKGAWIDALVK